MASGIWSQLLCASTPKHLCVRKIFIGKIYCTLNIQGIYLYRVIIVLCGVGRASIKQVIVLWITEDPSHHLVQSCQKGVKREVTTKCLDKGNHNPPTA